MKKPLFRSDRKKIGVVEAPYLRSPDRYYVSILILALCLAPLYAMAAGRLGYKLIILLILTCASGAITETLGSIISARAPNYFGVAAWLIFPLLVPPGIPLHISIISIVAGLIIAQVLFGGFGKHIFHPAVFAQIFMLINFAKLSNSSFLKPFGNPYFGLSAFSSMSFTDKTALKELASGIDIPLSILFLGPNIGQAGELFPFLIMGAGALYLLLGDVQYRTPLSFLFSFVVLSYIGNRIFPADVLSPLKGTLSGGTFFYAFFIFSDRWSGSKTRCGRIISGVMAAVITLIIRSFSSNIEGIMFAAAFNYSFSPLYDEIARLPRRHGKSAI